MGFEEWEIEANVNTANAGLHFHVSINETSSHKLASRSARSLTYLQRILMPSQLQVQLQPAVCPTQPRVDHGMMTALGAVRHVLFVEGA